MQLKFYYDVISSFVKTNLGALWDSHSFVAIKVVCTLRQTASHLEFFPVVKLIVDFIVCILDIEALD